jgi:hypothetical protein
MNNRLTDLESPAQPQSNEPATSQDLWTNLERVGLQNPSRRLIKLREHSRQTVGQTSSKCFIAYAPTRTAISRSDGPREVLNRSRTSSAHPALTFYQQAGSARSVWRRSRYARCLSGPVEICDICTLSCDVVSFCVGLVGLRFLGLFCKRTAARHFDTSHLAPARCGRSASAIRAMPVSTKYQVCGMSRTLLAAACWLTPQ